jgi:hypothetical protein
MPYAALLLRIKRRAGNKESIFTGSCTIKTVFPEIMINVDFQ